MSRPICDGFGLGLKVPGFGHKACGLDLSLVTDPRPVTENEMGLDHIVYLSHSKIRHILHTRRVPD